jgi:hypothetical protein
MRPWLAIASPALVLGLQHIAVPLLSDMCFVLWRGLMYIPFALFAGIVSHWRPRLLPYKVIVHVVMELSLVAKLLSMAYQWCVQRQGDRHRSLPRPKFVSHLVV